MKTILVTFMLLISLNGFARSTHVRGYIKKSGTVVSPHYRSQKDSLKFNNYSHKGNINPYTGKRGTKR